MISLPNGSFTHPGDSGEHSTGLPRISIAPREGEVLSILAIDKDVLEIGTGLGISTRYMEMKAKSITTVDTDIWVHKNINLPTRVIRLSDVGLIAPSVKFDLIFIDGDHRTPSVKRDIEFSMSHLKQGGMMVLHDAHDGKVSQAVKELDLSMYVVNTTYGLGILSV